MSSAELPDVLHDRALVWLRSHLRGQRYRAGRGHVEPGNQVMEAGNEGRLLALEHVGAITGDEAAQWRLRLHEAARWEQPLREPPSGRAVALAVAHLERLLTPVSAASAGGAAACFSAIAAFEQTGIFTADEALAWRERLRAKLGLEPERPPRCSRRNLLRVIAGPAERVNGLRITSLELYDDGVALLWHHAEAWAAGPDTPRVWNDVDVETAGADELEPQGLTDDLGTRFIGDGVPDFGINGGGSVVRFGTSVFTPAVPTDARRLRVRLSDGGIDIAL